MVLRSDDAVEDHHSSRGCDCKTVSESILRLKQKRRRLEIQVSSFYFKEDAQNGND